VLVLYACITKDKLKTKEVYSFEEREHTSLKQPNQ